MKLYSLLFLAFIIQEPISSNGILLEAYQNHTNIWIIHLLFVVATLFDAMFFYWLGQKALHKFPHNKLVNYLKNKTIPFTSFVGKNGKRIALFIYGPIIFPASAFIAPWLGISFWESTVFQFLGDLVFWYGCEWILVLGVKSFIFDPNLALAVTLTISFMLLFVLRFINQRKSRKTKNSLLP